MASVESFDDEYILTDEYGAKLMVVPFDYNGEKWVHVYIDSPNGEVREFLEEFDDGLNVPLWMLDLFTQYVVKHEDR